VSALRSKFDAGRFPEGEVPKLREKCEMTHSTACPDWERRIIAGESLIPLPPLFPEAAERDGSGRFQTGKSPIRFGEIILDKVT
jgi:hypothetical protein